MRLFSAVFLLLVPVLAHASDVGGWTSFRCPPTHELLGLGLSTYEVRARCREPDDVVVSVETRRVRRTVVRSPGHAARAGKGAREVEEIEDTVEIQVENWIFDFGRNRFVTKLRFENGRLVAIVDGVKGVAEAQ